MSMVVVVCGKDARLLSKSGFSRELKPLPKQKIGETFERKDVVFLKHGIEWATEEAIADELRTKLEIKSFRILSAATFPIGKLNKGDAIVFVGAIEGDGWLVAEM